MRKFFFVVAMMSLIANLAVAQEEFVPSTSKGLFWTQYAFDFTHIFVGKVVKGRNVLKSLAESAYQAAPAAYLHHAGFKMVAKDWRDALPAQLLVQKGNWIVRKSILNQNLFSHHFITDWEIDYLIFNVRNKGLKPQVRVNFATTVWSTLGFGLRDWTNKDEAHRFNLGMSLRTGTMYFDSRYPKEEYMSGGSIGNIVGVEPGDNRYTISHELIHTFQEMRGNALIDPLFQQDLTQTRDGYDDFPDGMRFDFGTFVNLFWYLGQVAADGPQEHDFRIHEREPESYVALYHGKR